MSASAQANWLQIGNLIATVILAIVSLGALRVSCTTQSHLQRQHRERQELEKKMHNEDQALAKDIDNVRVENQKPRLVAFETRLRLSRTDVLVRNVGLQQASVMKMVFLVEDERPSVEGWPAVPVEAETVAFSFSEYDLPKKRFTKAFDTPLALQGGVSLMVRLVVVNHDQAGKSYVGTLEIHYDTDEPLVVPSVTVPVLAKVPEFIE